MFFLSPHLIFKLHQQRQIQTWYPSKFNNSIETMGCLVTPMPKDRISILLASL